MMDNRKIGRICTIALWVVIIALLVGAIQTQRSGRKQTLHIDEGEWAKLLLVLSSVDNDYVDEIDHKAVTESILPEIMSKLDPHSIYLPPVELEEAEEDLMGGFDGIGIQFNVPNDTAIVTSVITGGPSEKAGLMTGDRIIMVDGKVIAGVGMPQDSMVKLMRGRKGTKVTVSMQRDGGAELIPFEITRGKIPVNSIDVAFMLDDTTGYVKLSKFARTSYLEFLQATLKLREKGMTRLVFDLRDNTGGYLDQAILLSNEFLDKGDLIVYMEGRKRERQDVLADGTGTCRNLELAVLINESSASSSEIFAGAMQDNDRGTIYGLRSFGKGLVQEPVYFSDGSGIRLTVARYFTPSGRCIQKPYSDDYAYDLIGRYERGEMLSADSIKVNDSLKFHTKAGRTVYGGGGITPDVFVPLDTTGVSDYLVKCNRQSLQVKFANALADRYRARLREITTLEALEDFLSSIDLKERFIEYTTSQGVVPGEKDWDVSGEVILTQAGALVGRYSALGEEGFYPIYLRIDNVIDAVMDKKVQTD